MNGFKERLQRELKQDVPFTDDVKRRLLQPKREKRQSNWKITLVSVVACGLAISLFSTLLFPQNNALQLANEGKELLPIVEVAEGQVIEPETANLLGEQWMLHFLPMVVDREANVTYGDYVAYYTPSGIVVSTVLGLAKDTVTMDDGQVTVDREVLTVRGLGEKMNAQIKKDPFQNPYYFYSWGEDKPFQNETIQTSADEFIVYSNDEQHQLVKITEAQILGKISAIQQVKRTFYLTAEEQKIYDAFKTDYNIELLRDVSPITLAKMSLISEIEKDFATSEALFTTVEDVEIYGTKQHYEKTKPVREAMFTQEINELMMAALFNGVEHGTFEQESETRGWVTFTNERDGETGLGFAKNKQGIWQPAFSRTVYIPID